jgi:hypothetical protein
MEALTRNGTRDSKTDRHRASERGVRHSNMAATEEEVGYSKCEDPDGEKRVACARCSTGNHALCLAVSKRGDA